MLQVPRNNLLVVQRLVEWENLSPEEATWENADFIKRVFPDIFKDTVQVWMHPEAVP
jgi:hypothetical protein